MVSCRAGAERVKSRLRLLLRTSGRVGSILVAAVSLPAFVPPPAFCGRSLGQAEEHPAQQGVNQASSVDSLMVKAQKALDAQDFGQAKAYLNLALQADPKSAEAYVLMGTMEFQSGETEQAIQHYRRALQLRPDLFTAHYNLALAYLREQNLQEGIRELRRAAALNPRHRDAAYNLGAALLDSGKPAEALEQLRRARSLGSERPDVAFNIVRGELALRNLDQARLEAEQAAMAFGSDAEWQAAIGRLFLANGQPRDASVRFQEALRLRPAWGEARRLLASAYVQSEQPAAVLALIQNPVTAEDHFLLASAHYLLRRFSESTRECNRCLELDHHEARYLLLGARLRQHSGEHAAALLLLQEASGLAPRWAEPYYSAGVSYYFERRYADCRQSLDQALRLDPRFVRALFLYAASLVNESKNSQAEEYLRRAIALDPSNARFQYHLGALLVRDNRLSAAQGAFDKAAQLKPDYALPHYQIGKLLARSGHQEDAARELEKAVQYEPDLAQAYYQLSRVYVALGQTEKSTRALAAFNTLKKQEVDEEREFLQEVNRELELP